MLAKLTKLAVRALDAATPRPNKNPQTVPEHLITGKRGEEAAYFRLRELGYVMVARNWKSRRRKGEIDLIGWEHDVLCFIEVKTRTTRDVKPAEAAVDRDKQHELRAMAREYIWRASRTKTYASPEAANDAHNPSRKNQPEMMCRFDVVSVYYDAGPRRVTCITLFRNAFSMS